MSRKKSRADLSDGDKNLWKKVTETITELNSNRAPTPLVRRSAYRIETPKQTFSALPISDMTEQSFSLKDADHNWQYKIRRGRAKPEGTIDLHGMTEERAYAALNNYIDQAQRRGKRLILVITGKGGRKSDYGDMSHSDYDRARGKLKTNVPRWLSQGELASRIVSYYAASGEHGGDGALYVVIKKVRS